MEYGAPFSHFGVILISGGGGSDVGLSGIDDLCGQSQDVLSSCGSVHPALSART